MIATDVSTRRGPLRGWTLFGRRASVRNLSRLLIGLSLLYLFAVWIAYPWVSGDTPWVLDGTNALLTCLSQHQFHACGFTGKLNDEGLMSPIGDWPLLQHVPDLISIGLGADSHPVRTRVLELLNVIGVGSSVVLARMVLARVGQTVWFPGFLLVLLSSPILWYARTTSGEVLASSLLVCLVAATVLRAPPALVGLAALGAVITKETSYPFVAAIGLLGLVLARRRTGEPIRSHVVWGVAGMAVGFAATSLFNVVRFGSILNTNYLDPHLHTPGISRKLEYAAAVLVAPSGGIFVFWPVASVLLAAACVLPLVLRSRRNGDVRPAVALIAVIAGLTIGFASWFTPFGWSGYGPRLFVPWILPLVLIALVAYGEELEKLARRVLAPFWRLLVVFGIVLVFTLPNIGEMWRPDSTGHFFLQKPVCGAPWVVGITNFHACQHRRIWLDRPMPLYALHGVKTQSGLATTIAVAAGLLGCLLLFRTTPSSELPGGRLSRGNRPAT
jgi:hypothetical protein